MYNIVLNQLTTKNGYFAVKHVGEKSLIKITTVMEVLGNHKR